MKPHLNTVLNVKLYNMILLVLLQTSSFTNSAGLVEENNNKQLNE